MVNRSKIIGTAGETGVKRYALEHGFPLADRRTQQGSADAGDILLCPGALLEVKAGKAAHAASLLDIDGWLDQTRVERLNAGADIAVLVVARRGYAPTRAGHWRAFFPEPWRLFHPLDGEIHARLVAGRVSELLRFPVEMPLDHALQVLRHAGWGNPTQTP